MHNAFRKTKEMLLMYLIGITLHSISSGRSRKTQCFWRPVNIWPLSPFHQTIVLPAHCHGYPMLTGRSCVTCCVIYLRGKTSTRANVRLIWTGGGEGGSCSITSQICIYLQSVHHISVQLIDPSFNKMPVTTTIFVCWTIKENLTSWNFLLAAPPPHTSPYTYF